MYSKRDFFSFYICFILIISCYLITILVGNRVITVFSEECPPKNVRYVIIDAGHGGEDGGTSASDGTLESNINLQIAIRTNDLMNLLGIQTVMTRNSNAALSPEGNTIAQRKIADLKERVHIINSTPNAVLISIHQNYYTQVQYHGTQVFYAPINMSKEFAALMQTAFHTALQPDNSRQIKKADGIYIMQNITCPGILIECGFLSNREEAQNLSEEGYQKKICCIIASVTSKYLFANDDIA